MKKKCKLTNGLIFTMIFVVSIIGTSCSSSSSSSKMNQNETSNVSFEEANDSLISTFSETPEKVINSGVDPGVDLSMQKNAILQNKNIVVETVDITEVDKFAFSLFQDINLFLKTAKCIRETSGLYNPVKVYQYKDRTFKVEEYPNGYYIRLKNKELIINHQTISFRELNDDFDFYVKNTWKDSGEYYTRILKNGITIYNKPDTILQDIIDNTKYWKKVLH